MQRIVLGMMAVGLIGVGAAPAAAAPTGAEFKITCGDDPADEFTVTMGPGQGVWTPAFVVGTNQRVIPFAISGTFVVDGDNDIDVNESKNAPRNRRLYEGCSFSDGGFGGLINGEVSFSLTPG
ncbi:hypothetical protein BH23ACT3_BH23ACT3_19040 [soil metagenome]